MLDFLTMGIAMIAISIVVFVSLNVMELMMIKLEVSQIARKYILAMETRGCLWEEDREDMLNELRQMGLKDIDIVGTTLQPVDYGENIVLSIKGNVSGWKASVGDIWKKVFEIEEYEVEEKRMSTAKN